MKLNNKLLCFGLAYIFTNTIFLKYVMKYKKYDLELLGLLFAINSGMVYIASLQFEPKLPA